MIHVDCPVCHGGEHRLRWRNAVDRLHGLPGAFTYVQCTQCELIYLDPQPDSDSLIDYYPPAYSPHQASPPSSESRRDHALSDYLSPQRRMEKFIRHRIPGASSLLDVGCGRGDFLARMRATMGCHPHGVDFSRKAVEVAKTLHGLNVFCGPLASAPFARKSFDLITMWWYLEHDPEPMATLARCRELLKDTGWLVFGVPNHRSFNASIFGTRWFHLDAPRHLNIFSPTSIRVLMKRSGFSLQRTDYDRSTWGLVGSLQYLVAGRKFDSSFVISANPLRRLLSLPLTVSLSYLRLS